MPCFIQSIKDDLVNEGGHHGFVDARKRVFSNTARGTGTNFSPLRGK